MNKEIQHRLKQIIANDPYLRERISIGIWDSGLKSFREPSEEDIERLQNIRTYTNRMLDLEGGIEEASVTRARLYRQVSDIDEEVADKQREMADIKKNYPEIFSEEMELF